MAFLSAAARSAVAAMPGMSIILRNDFGSDFEL